MRFLTAAACALLTGPAARAVDVLVMSVGLKSIDDAAVAALEAGGHKVTVGPQYFEFTDKVDLGKYGVVYFQANNNWFNGPMPTSGQEALASFIDAGGGMVTSEWATYEATVGRLGVLEHAFPGKYLGVAGGPLTTYTKAAADPVLNKGLPDAIEFPLDDFSGSETYFGVKCGATLYYKSSTSSQGGTIGWHFGVGRVLSFSTCAGEKQLADPDFARLLSNAVSWAVLAGGQPGGYSPDCDASGFLDLFDFLCFTNAFNAQQKYADCDGDGSLTLFDFLCYVNEFNAGC